MPQEAEYEHLYVLWTSWHTGEAKVIKLRIHKDDIAFAKRNLKRNNYPTFTNYWHAYAALLKLKGTTHDNSPHP